MALCLRYVTAVSRSVACWPVPDRSREITLPRSVADVVSRHVLFEIESIDRMYCNLYVPQLQRVEGLLAFIHGHLGQRIASTSVIAPMSPDFIARLDAFAKVRGIPRAQPARGQRKDDVMQQYLAAFQAAGRTEGVLLIGRRRRRRRVPPRSAVLRRQVLSVDSADDLGREPVLRALRR